MGIITLFFLIVFSLLYVSKSIPKKPPFLIRAVDKITDNLHQLSIWGLVYGTIATVLTPLSTHYGNFELMIRFLANIMIVVTALPLTADYFLDKYHDRINAVIASEIKKLAVIIARQEKILGFVSAGIGVMLFLILFR